MEEAAVPAPDSSKPAAPVRVVAGICPGGTGSFKVAARVVDSSAVVSLLPPHEDHAPESSDRTSAATRKDCEYRLDSCYCCSKDDDSCHRIFHGEVKSLVDAIFTGTNSCVVACGAAVKTQLIKGLLIMAMDRILLLSQPIGAAVSVSSYQVLQDTHVFDLLEPKDSEVLVLEDADGRTNFKGLSKVHVKSVQEFADLCCCGTSMLKHCTKPSNHMRPRGGHHGFIIYVSSFDQEGKECALAKMNFLQLAGYVDPKQRTNGGNCNKSMHALMNVVQALNSNQSFIPYRQSKITRILQDSLCKTNKAVLIACMDELPSQDAISTLSLASRSSQGVGEEYHNLSLGTRSSSKSNIKISASAKNLSRSLLPSIHQPSSALGKYTGPKLNNSAVKASRTPAADKRSKVVMHSAKKPASSLATYTKQRAVKPALSGRKLFCPGTSLSKENKIVTAPTEITKPEELQLSPGIKLEGSLLAEGCGETEKVLELIPCSMQEPVSCSVKEEDSLSGLHADHLCTNSEEMRSSDVAGVKTPLSATQSSPKVTDRLREISNSLKLLSTMPVRVTKQKPDMVDAQNFHTDLLEPKTPEVHLKSGHAEDSHELLEARSTGVKKIVARECLTFLNSANKEQLKSLKGIGEKRANYILELREESQKPFKEIDDLKNIIGMNGKEIKTLLSGMVIDL